MSSNQTPSQRPSPRGPQSSRPNSTPSQDQRPRAHRVHSLETVVVLEQRPGAAILVPTCNPQLTVVLAGGGPGRGRGGGGGGGGGRQMRIDEMLQPTRVANRIAETQDDGRAGALNARSSRDNGGNRDRPSSDTDAQRRPQRSGGGGGSGRDSPSGRPDDRRGYASRDQDPDRPSHNRLDEATLSSDPARASRAQVANETLKILYEEKYTTPAGVEHDIHQWKQDLAQGTKFYSAKKLTDWQQKPTGPPRPPAKVNFVEQSTVAVARFHAIQAGNADKVGVLNFASAKKRGGGFKNGAQAQEESLARASTLYLSLTQPEANRFYDTHIKSDDKGYYSHSMIYSRGVTLIRDEHDQLVDPSNVNVVTCAAVNAGSVKGKAGKRKSEEVEVEIQRAMFERMARILKCFEENGDRILVLGSFGTGVFRNDIGTVASIWAELLGPDGRFSQSFDLIEFAILGRSTFDKFQNAWNDQLSRAYIRKMEVAERARP
ncbi:hypothetical protein FRB90_011854 [Tulasnella sp. 427]|nr:hypothetical protein FRB90_011854 [Tulasnella sp. 427]